MPRINYCLLMVLLLLTTPVWTAQNPATANYDESKVGDYSLPDVLVLANGTRVKSRGQWELRRKELLEQFASQVYGRTRGPRGAAIRLVERSRVAGALGGLATRIETTVELLGRSNGPRMELLLYLPNQG